MVCAVHPERGVVGVVQLLDGWLPACHAFLERPQLPWHHTHPRQRISMPKAVLAVPSTSDHGQSGSPAAMLTGTVAKMNTPSTTNVTHQIVIRRTPRSLGVPVVYCHTKDNAPND